jgi:hypothetical protein
MVEPVLAIRGQGAQIELGLPQTVTAPARAKSDHDGLQAVIAQSMLLLIWSFGRSIFKEDERFRDQDLLLSRP